jgi:hypothetical protein
MAILALGGKWIPLGWGEKVWTSNFPLQLGLVEEEARVKAKAEAKTKAEAEAKAAAELKAKQEAEARADAAKNKTTITCVKGKSSLKVIGKNPKCPSGYRKK